MRKFVFCILLSMMLFSFSSCEEETIVDTGSPIYIGLEFIDKNGEAVFDSEVYKGMTIDLVLIRDYTDSDILYHLDWEAMEFVSPLRYTWAIKNGYLEIMALTSDKHEIEKYKFIIPELSIEYEIELYHTWRGFLSVKVNGEELPLSTDPEFHDGEEPVATVVI